MYHFWSSFISLTFKNKLTGLLSIRTVEQDENRFLEESQYENLPLFNCYLRGKEPQFLKGVTMPISVLSLQKRHTWRPGRKASCFNFQHEVLLESPTVGRIRPGHGASSPLLFRWFHRISPKSYSLCLNTRSFLPLLVDTEVFRNLHLL